MFLLLDTAVVLGSVFLLHKQKNVAIIHLSKHNNGRAKMLNRIANVLSKNLGYKVVLVAAIILFAVFSDGLISGLITAVSALLGYTCIVALVKEYKNEPAPKAAPAKKAPVKKTGTKKPTTKKK